MLKYICCFYLLLVSVGCNESNQKKPSTEPNRATSDQPILKSDIASIKYTEYGIGRETASAVSNWIQYKELNENIERLKEGDISFLIQDQEILKTFFNDLRTNIPSKVDTKSIRARLLVLENQVLKANSLLKLRNIEKDEKSEAIKQVLIAMSTFNDQMNKKFEIEANNILRRQ